MPSRISELTRGELRPFKRDLGKFTGTVRIPHAVGCYFVDSFDGDPTKTWIGMGGAERGASFVPLYNRIGYTWDVNTYPEGVELWIRNDSAQSGKTLKIQYGPPGAVISGPLAAVGLESAAGVAINPATLESVQAVETDVVGIHTRLGDVEASPTANTVLDRLKTLARLIGGSPTCYNVTMTLADTEYSQALPDPCKGLLIGTQDGTAFRLAFVTGKVATPTAPYMAIPANTHVSFDSVYWAATTVYVGCGSAAKVAQMIALGD